MPSDQAATILVVEDDIILQQLLQEVLAEAGYQLLQATDGVQGLHLAAVHRPAVILLDMALPRFSGAEVLLHLKQDRATTHIPVLAISGLPQLANGLGALAGWIDKPIDLDVLVEHVGRLAGRQHPRAATAVNGRG
jgi:CheY-like chemotaxis protein